MPRAPIDPFCATNGPAREIIEGEEDANLAALAGYAKGLATKVWVFPDGKIGLTNDFLKDATGNQRASLVFGAEGDNVSTNAAKAFAALHGQSERLQQEAFVARHIRTAGETGRIDPIDPVADPLEFATQLNQAVFDEGTGEIGLTVDTLRGAAEAKDVNRYITGKRRLAGSPMIIVRSALSRLGPLGNMAKQLYQRTDEMKDRILNNVLREMNVQAMRLTPQERAEGYQLFIEKGVAPADPSRAAVMQDVYNNMNRIDNQFWETAQRLGLDVAPRIEPNNRVPTGNYFPHRFDMAELGKRGSELREKSVQSIMDNMREHGVTGTDDELRMTAESRIDLYLKKRNRISGGLERERLGVPYYIKDFVQAYTIQYTKNAHRIAEVAVLGKGDSRISAILQRMRAEGDVRGEMFLQQVHDLQVGNTRIGFSSDLMRELYNWQGAKLSLAAIANLGQGINTFLRVGLGPFVKAAAQVAAHPLKAAERVQRSGALPVMPFGTDSSLKLVNETIGHFQENGLANALSRDFSVPTKLFGAGSKFIRKWGLLPFRLVETINRSMAQTAGEIYFDDVVKAYTRRPSKLNTSRLLELDLSPERVAEAIARGDTQLLGEMRTMAGLRISNETQFRSNYQSMPLYANNSELGRFMFQFKNYSFGQVSFIMNELAVQNHKDPARFMRALAGITLAYPAVGVALTTIRFPLLGPTFSGDEIADRLNQGGVGNVLAAGAVALGMQGGLGILSDLGSSAITGNRFVLESQFQPPAMATALNLWDAGASAFKGTVGGDPLELDRAKNSFLREFGGVGGAVVQGRKTGRGIFGYAQNVLGPSYQQDRVGGDPFEATKRLVEDLF